MVPSQLLCLVRFGPHALPLVDDYLHHHHRAVARRVQVVCHFRRIAHVRPKLPSVLLRFSFWSSRIPIGVLAFVTSFSGPLSNKISPKYVLLFAQCILVVATCLLATADSPSKYYSHVLPAFILGSAGAMLSYTHTK